jgi:two-component system response regulator MprA
MAPMVLVVDDDVKVANSVRRALQYEDLEVVTAHDGPEALSTAIRLSPDVVVLDVMLPGLDGFAVCRALRAANQDCLVLMLTARDDTADRVTGLDAGADDYLVKPFAHEELVARVRALLRRRRAPEPSASQPAPPSDQSVWADDLVVDPVAREVRRAGRRIDLTALEFDLLLYFVRHPRQVLTRQQLLNAVWGGGPASTTNVVDVYVGYVRAKVGEPRLVHTVRGVGYVLRSG